MTIRRSSLLLVGLVVLVGASESAAVETQRTPAALVETADAPGMHRSAIGVTRRGTSIPCLITDDDLDLGTSKTRILLVGGLEGAAASVDATLAAMRWFHTSAEAEPWRKRFAVSAVPAVNVDAWLSAGGPENSSNGNPSKGYPPKGPFYGSTTDPEAAYLWRWIGMHAPDLVIEVRAGEAQRWEVPAGSERSSGGLTRRLSRASTLAEPDALAAQLPKQAPSNVGTVPALRYVVAETNDRFLKDLLVALDGAKFPTPSPARRELQRRLARAPIEVATELSERYGRRISGIVYTQTVALVGRIRLGELTGDRDSLADIEKIVAPYVTGDRSFLVEKVSGSVLSGCLVFAELARVTGDDRYDELVRTAADFAFDEAGKPKEAMPFHHEMSDSVFMACPILVQAGKLTGDAKYYDMALRNLRFLRNLDLREDGFYRHSPLDETAWGRGNGFPALGLAWCLTDLPTDHAGRDEMLAAFRAHVAALARHQDPTGAWHQVIDHPGSYRELTSTCMITYALIRGVRSGWLDEATYRPVIDKAWQAIRTRVATDGSLVDVCTGTGKQKDLRAYFDRRAVLGHDARGGAMALLVATEMAQWQADRR